jgi:hypothetical protein
MPVLEGARGLYKGTPSLADDADEWNESKSSLRSSSQLGFCPSAYISAMACVTSTSADKAKGGLRA